jgi:ATP-dependent Zn protease
MEMIMKSPLAEKYVDKLNEIMKRELDITIDIISRNKDKVGRLADALIDRSRLDTDEMKEILGLI